MVTVKSNSLYHQCCNFSQDQSQKQEDINHSLLSIFLEGGGSFTSLEICTVTYCIADN